MPFVASTEVWNIKSNLKKILILLLTQQKDGSWVATVYFTINGIVNAHHECRSEKKAAFSNACKWVLANLDQQARFTRL